MKRKNLKPALFLNSATDYNVVNEHGETVSLEAAKALWKSGTLDDWNMAFARLARSNFDIEATKASYKTLDVRGEHARPGNPGPEAA